MTFSAHRLVSALSCSFAVLLAGAQSGTPAVMTPMANPDPRLAAIHAQTGKVMMPSGVALSPDGTVVAWSLRGGEESGGGSTLHLNEVNNPNAAREKTITPKGGGTCSNGSPVWSPDSKTLAFSSTCTGDEKNKDQEQIFLYTRSSGEVRQLTHLNGIFHQVAWAPDGKALAFLFVEEASRSAGALAAMKPWSGVVGEDGVEIQRIGSVQASDGAFHFVSPATLHVYEFGWSPDAKAFTYVAAAPPGENNWWVAKLYTQKPASAPKVIFNPNTTKTSMHGLQIAVPRWSPDGKHIAFIGGLMSDQGSTGGDVWTVPSAGGDATDVTPGIDGSPTYLAWLTPTVLGLAEDRRGHSLLVGWDVAQKTAVKGDFIDLGETNITGGPIKMAVSVAHDGAMAFVKSGHSQAPEVFVGPIESIKQITHLNDAAKSSAKTESIEWKSDGFDVQGWLMYPKDYDAARKYPLLVDVHGGPSASASARWGSSVWSELGYFVFLPNPRGSFGEGEKFTAANVKDFGYGDLRDILAGMDAVEKRVSIDTHREGLMGWSYGGFMTMFAVTQTNRFRAAVAGAGVSNWKSYYGENSIDQWMVPFFGATVYDDPAVYAKSSAIEYIKKVKTPTLVVVGDRDGECPAPQSFEFWHALRAEGVKTQLVVYPNEGHHFVDPAHVKDLEARQVAWFAEEMPAQ